tara:strand:- start:82 stop:330 length:249 start_codon:yes stop_codon:yes gene_type:complete
MDPSLIPKDILPILQDKELSVAQKMVAFNMLMPNLPASPEHNKAYNENLEVGETIKRLVDEGKISLKFDKKFKLNIEVLKPK